MYPALPFGPFTLPTGPIFVLLAGYFGLETAARFGRRFGLRSDDVWNAGLLGVLAGFIVARLWNVIQFWYCLLYTSAIASFDPDFDSISWLNRLATQTKPSD